MQSSFSHPLLIDKVEKVGPTGHAIANVTALVKSSFVASLASTDPPQVVRKRFARSGAGMSLPGHQADDAYTAHAPRPNTVVATGRVRV